MKKLFLSAALFVLITASSFAGNVNNEASTTPKYFSLQFVNAENIQWTSTKDYVKASFVVNNKNMEAFYEHDGRMIGTTSAIKIDELPTNAKRSFAKKYSGYTVREAIQFDVADETAYYISADNEARSLVIKVSSEGFVSIFKSSKK